MISQGQNKTPKRHSQQGSEKGQIVLEYVLILTVTVALASVIVSSMVQRSTNPDEQGFIIQLWIELTKVIASDI